MGARKAGAVENSRYRDELFPTSRFRMAFDALEQLHGKQGSKEYLRILELAAKESEARVDEALRTLLELADMELSAERIEAMLESEQHVGLREVEVTPIDLHIFDQLFTAAEVLQ